VSVLEVEFHCNKLPYKPGHKVPSFIKRPPFTQLGTYLEKVQHVIKTQVYT